MYATRSPQYAAHAKRQPDRFASGGCSRFAISFAPPGNRGLHAYSKCPSRTQYKSQIIARLSGPPAFPPPLAGEGQGWGCRFLRQRSPLFVMAGVVPAIHACSGHELRRGCPRTSAGMTSPNLMLVLYRRAVDAVAGLRRSADDRRRGGRPNHSRAIDAAAVGRIRDVYARGAGRNDRRRGTCPHERSTAIPRPAFAAPAQAAARRTKFLGETTGWPIALRAVGAVLAPGWPRDEFVGITIFTLGLMVRICCAARAAAAPGARRSSRHRSARWP